MGGCRPGTSLDIYEVFRLSIVVEIATLAVGYNV